MVKKSTSDNLSGITNYYDIYHRRFSVLRVSLGHTCNLQCVYCVPPNFKEPVASAALSANELVYLIKLLREVAGLAKLRITGGEPLLSKKFQPLLKGAAFLGFEQIGITTNGSYLLDHLDFLKLFPQISLNVSLDTLDSKTSGKLNGASDLSVVLKAIRRARALKIPLKINMVLLRGINFQDVLPVLDFCFEHKIVCRFIELMKMGHITDEFFKEQFVSAADVLALISNSYGIKKISRTAHATAVYYQAKGGRKFGVIANETLPFCQDCNRLRLNADGEIYGCLSNNSALATKHLLKMDSRKAKAELSRILTTAMSHKQKNSFQSSQLIMRQIGG